MTKQDKIFIWVDKRDAYQTVVMPARAAYRAMRCPTWEKYLGMLIDALVAALGERL